MSTTWTLTAADICTDALQHLGVVGDGESASGADMQLALRALDGILKGLPLSGYIWPKLSAEVSLTYVPGGVIPLPSDFYGYATVWRTENGQKFQLSQIPHAQWIERYDRNYVNPSNASGPNFFYIGADNVLRLYPIPPVGTTPVLTLQYQRIVDDVVLNQSPNLPQYWMNPLGYGVASELALKFNVPQAERIEIAQRWKAKFDSALESSIAFEVIEFGVRD